MTAARILLVDDDPDLLRLLSWRLQGQGFAVSTACSAEEALAIMPGLPPSLVITDLRMAHMDGLGLVERIHRENPALPVIILTAHGTIAEAVQAMERGAFSFLTKPFDGQDLLAAVRQALRQGSADGTPMRRPESRIMTRSAAMQAVLLQAERAAGSASSVLIRGESGTGKELLAQTIHDASPRSGRPFVAVNCSAIPEALLESELFGHQKGSFTGAAQHYEGLLRSADGGTLFLDEIGDMPLALQAKLLRVLQERQIRQVGSTRTLPIDVRVLSATHRNLEDAMQRGAFREDLYYRLNVVCLRLPTLAERREDIPLLAHHFLRVLNESSNAPSRSFAPAALDVLIEAPWPGNVRQLRNVIEQACVLSAGPLISAQLVRGALTQEPVEALSFKEARTRFEQRYLMQVLQLTNGNVSEAARLAQRNRTEFYRLLRRHHLDPGLFKERAAASPPDDSGTADGSGT
ncbi:MAG TPA: sigma-54 dependent transcriptional regulator [Acidiferrobacteraceae bacterium]|nr:sigma-54 dependent transcriptional regulator [Acidiferrobacteraceae bacterium]